MNLSEQITKLLRNGISEMTFGMSPEGSPFVSVVQNLQTGAKGNIIQIRHQRCAPSLVQCVESVAADIEHCAKLHVPTPDGKIIQAPRG
jgi:hypothetical protein